ncbi:MAG: DEAD/DEAH box helicase family protein [Patescibacteria group bacterium]
MLKEYQKRVVKDIEEFFEHLDKSKATAPDYVSSAFTTRPKYRQYPDRPITGTGKIYPRVCIKMPTGGGKTLIAIETIRAYQNLFAKRKTGLIVWITHRDQIYRQTIENLQNKSHVYRQFLDQASGNRTLILEKGQAIRRQDVEENLVVLMLMIQSARNAEANKIFEDSGGYTDFFPLENRYDLHKALFEQIPNLDRTEDSLFERIQIKTSLGNVIRTLEPLIIVDEFHTMFTDIAQSTLNGLNPSVIIGLSATPKRGMNIISSVSGRDLKEEEMIKLEMHLRGPNRDWQEMLAAVKQEREELEKKAKKLAQNKGTYIRPIALIQVERTGREQHGQGRVHSEDVREALIGLGVPQHEIAIKSASLDEIKQQKLLSKESEIRYIITKEALKEGWDCSFAYILGVIPNARNNASMTQLVGRILRQPYAKKTGIADLDESYVFFASGHTQEVLEKVRQGFEDEGLGDVISGIEVQDTRGAAVNQLQLVFIKKDILKKYPESLFLPVWLTKEGKLYRRFSYEMDIRPRVDWSSIKIDAWLKELKPTIGQRRGAQTEVIVDLEGAREREVEANVSVRFDSLYLTRRLYETVENAFIAHSIAEQVFAILDDEFDAETLDRDAGYIAREIEKRLVKHRRDQERAAFEKLVSDGTLLLVVSDDNKIGFSMPTKDEVSNSIRSAYRLNLYEDVDISTLNPLERDVVQYIEDSPSVIWWARNKAEKSWYAIQGWQKNKIRPDFIIASKKKDGALEFLYIVESKGEQLTGNPDTQYKMDVFDTMNKMQGDVEKVTVRMTTMKLNDRFEFELVPQGEEERRIRETLNL